MGAPTILVVRHQGLGDLMTAQPALRALRRHFPAHRLAVTCPSWLLPLAHRLATADTWISETFADGEPCKHLDIDQPLLAGVPAQVPACDIIVSMRTPGPELLRLVAGTSHRLLVSYRYEALSVTTDWPELDFSDHILVRWRRLLAPIGVIPRDEDLTVSLVPPEGYIGFTVVHVGAGSPARLWPVERWAEVISRLSSQGHRVVLPGVAQEEVRAKEVVQLAGLSADSLRCRTDIMQLAWLVAGARLVLSTDTGVAHLATSFGTRAVTLFGPVPPQWWGPPPGTANHLTLWAGLLGECYSEAADPGLLAITVNEVLAAVERLHG